MLSAQVYDVVAATRQALNELQVSDPQALHHIDGIRRSPPQVQFGAAMREGSNALKQFLMRNLYRHPQVMQTTNQARTVVRDLFAHYLQAPQDMQSDHQELARLALALPSVDADPAGGVARVVADYIAGMTDRMAAREHERFTGLRLLA
jgi:dGTPase